MDDYEGSLFASLFWMVGVICSPMGGFLSGWLGRRKIILLTTPLVAIGWIIIGFANNKLMLYLGRIISSGTIKLILTILLYRGVSLQSTIIKVVKRYLNEIQIF